MNTIHKNKCIENKYKILPSRFADSVYLLPVSIQGPSELVVKGYCHQVAVNNLIMGFKFPGINKLAQDSG